MGIPLTYVQRNHNVVTLDILMGVYDATDVEFVCTFKLEGGAYKAGTKNLYDELKSLSIDGPDCIYVNPYGIKRGGRGDSISLKRQDIGNTTSKQ